jgi:predicted molibdopterin-dependent oxidoreductase YjgC
MEENRDRVLTPLVRKDGGLKAATWDEAYKVIAEKFGALTKEKKQVAGFISTRLPIESLHYFKQLFKDGMKANTSTIVDGYIKDASNLAFETKSPATFDDVRNADCVVAIGEDISKDHQVVSYFVKRNLPSGSKLITVSTEDNGLDSFAHVSIKNTKLAEAIKSIGKDAKAIEILKASENIVFIFGGHAAECEECKNALLELAKEFKVKLLNTYDGANGKPADALDLVGSVDCNKLDAAYIALGDENVSQAFCKNLDKVPFVVVQSSYSSTLTANADVVLPALNWLEQSGHYMNMEGKLTEAKASLNAPDGVACNTTIIKNVAANLDITISEDWQAALQ